MFRGCNRCEIGQVNRGQLYEGDMTIAGTGIDSDSSFQNIFVEGIIDFNIC